MRFLGPMQPFVEACLHDCVNGLYAVGVVSFVNNSVVLPVLTAFFWVERVVVFANDHKAFNGGGAPVAKILVAVADGLGKIPLAARMKVGVAPQKLPQTLGGPDGRVDEHAVGRKQRGNLRGIKSAKR